MNVGIVSHWFNRGQATVARHIRSIFDGLGHKTFVLARPTTESFVFPTYTSDNDIWEQQGVTKASAYNISETEYLAWSRKCNIDVAFFDQNYQFDCIRKLRQQGLVTIGRFVWESFAEKHAKEAREAFSIIYSLTLCERERYHSFGIDSPYLLWGCHPELLSFTQHRSNQGRNFFYAGGYLSARKPTGAVIKAFADVPDAALRLLIKTQCPLSPSDLTCPATLDELKAIRKLDRGQPAPPIDDPRVTVQDKDVSMEDYYCLFSSSNVSMAPSRWEGLGLHLYEALAFGIPTISLDIQPINEVITHGVDGLLVKSRPIGETPSGITAYEPDVGDLANAIRSLTDPVNAQKFADGTRHGRKYRDWAKTVSAYAQLLAHVT